jgi:putative hydrolase of the HAD superfamily
MPLLLCDLDGTLVDRAGAFQRWASDLAARHNQDNHFVRWLVGTDNDGMIAREELYAALQSRIRLEMTCEEFVADYGEHYPSFFEPDPKVKIALERARHRGWTIAVVTNGNIYQSRKIAAVGLEGSVDTVCISSVEGVWKPDPRLLQIAADRTFSDLTEACIIGDSADADIGAAHAAGIPSVWLHRGRSWPRSDYEPSAQANSFLHAVDLVLHGNVGGQGTL